MEKQDREQNKKQDKIVFRIGEESRPIIERKIGGSLFTEQYRKAFDSIEAYIGRIAEKQDEAEDRQNRDRAWEREREDKPQRRPLYRHEIESNNEFDNNIISFIGERGSGKTSCMMSVANMLLHKDSKEEKDQQQLAAYGNIQRASFQTIDLIDPSFFDDTHNIIAIVVAKLFNRFNEEVKRELREEDFEERRKLVERFNETQKQMRCLLGKKEEELDDISQLVSLSAAVDLKESLRKLIDCYLNFFGSRKSPRLLLLMVDDIDLNISEASEMAEQIRKYLILPNVLILMSVKLTQLARLKWQQFAEGYARVLQEQQMSRSTVSEMVERYLAKFIPYHHRIFMPGFEAYGDMPLSIEYKGEPLDFVTIRQAVPELIFRKTRYLFYNSETHTSYIVPRNLRELRLLVVLLYGMQDARSSRDRLPEEERAESDRTRRYNQTLFKQYLFDTWIGDNLDMADRELIGELLQIDDAPRINRRVVMMLVDKFDLRILLQNDEGDDGFMLELRSVIRTDNVNYNLSVGDVLSLLSQLEKRFSDENLLKFIFVLRAFYSIKLYEYYDEKTAALDRVAEKKQVDPLQERKIFSNPVLAGLSNYDQLVAGRYVNSRFDEFLPKAASMPSRSNRRINLTALQNLIKDCVDHWDKRDSRIIQLVEFFMLCTARSFDTRNNSRKNPDFYEPEFRTKQNVRYAEPLYGDQNAYFDLNAFFYNITRIKECYSRFSYGAEFFERANKNDINNKSLWYRFKFATILKDQNLPEIREIDLMQFSMHRWLSWCTIRNVEILQALNATLLERRASYRGDEPMILVHFFRQISRFRIPTYDRIDNPTDNATYYTISLRFVDEIIFILRQVSVSLNLQKLFFSIYADFSPNEYEGHVDAESFLRGWRTEGNRTSTVIRKLKEKYAVYEYNTRYRSALKGVFAEYGDRITRAEIETAIEHLNKMIARFNG